jgi:hypothetical protein
VKRLTLALALVLAVSAPAQNRQEPGHAIGSAVAKGNLIVLTLNEGALGKANMFDLGHRTLRFTPEEGGYRVENAALQWDGEFGAELEDAHVLLHGLTFPFSGKNWDSFSVGINGSISFGSSGGGRGGGGGGGRGGGVTLARFDQLQEAARTLVNGAPSICVFLKLRMSGHRYFKQLPDRAVVTWDLTEPYGGIQDFTWTPTVNRFQAVLHGNGSIDLSYEQVTAKDAIVGVYPTPAPSEEKVLDAWKGEAHPAIAPHLDIQNIRISAVSGLFLKVTLETRGPVLPAVDPGAMGLQYRVSLGAASKENVVWTIRGMGRGGRAGGGARYIASGLGVAPEVKVDGNTISFQGTVPAGAKQLAVSADVLTPGTPPVIVDKVPTHIVTLTGVRSPDVHFSSVKREDGPFPVVYESFHYLSLPNPRDLTCSVIQALGDKFDMLAYYSDFRVDNQEAGTPSNGPLGGNVTGIGQVQRGLENYCSQGRFQWQFIQPVYVGSNQMQEHVPAGVTSSNTHDVMTYDKQLGERSPDGHMTAYNYAMSQIGHEMGHRWSAFVSAKVNGETIQLGPTHWARGLQAQVAFPYQRPMEASAMGGGVWQDNFDGTFTQLDDDYYVPATGWSYLDLYLMGLITAAEVPDFFILRNLVPAGRDANGHGIFKADRTKVTIQDVIAVEGPRLPTVDRSQKNFNTGMVVVVEHGKTPSKELIERTNGIREKWMDYWTTTTGHRSTMTANPR